MRLLIFWVIFIASLGLRADTDVLALNATQPVYELAGHLQYVEDSSRTLTVADLLTPELAARFVRPIVKGRLNFGYTTSAYWLRIQLSSPAESS